MNDYVPVISMQRDMVFSIRHLHLCSVFWIMDKGYGLRVIHYG